ncbi:tRNA (adenosine(37)-N6)-dimethylallyltransferase MiaA [Clostridium formicaceticum]|uniref:tRNA dimethylallyltransferase n=1 Tax=Clostridium formicaceticum TaxID=1497 RepID=A0AAC9WGC5_9CLOT|nr:tRNA (adenosine(37)-N6)-dimethylallyltransferase MiaA [Clostridium formicaceticum]AOY77171.1 tRNA (adenosine(37)-N6)-dimethylallyltransferase MiaA [Clostridium formicaceticum]ARE87691.1 tRNA dimethylallyltransferase [Clostridium formicaceticum]
MKKKLLILVGPTAVGKTDTSIELAMRLEGEIISADSMQIYKLMNIGTAKPSVEEMQGIPHYLMDIIMPNEDFSVAAFQQKAKAAIEEITNKKKLPIIVGGTGLYVNAIIYNMDFTSTVSNWQLRNQLQEEALKYGNEYLHNKLREIDPEAAERIHKNNVKRVIRAIEVFHESGEKIGNFREDVQFNDAYNFILIGLTRDREELYTRINHRVDIMMKEGLVQEVRNLLEMGYPEDLVAFKGLGYKEVIHYLKGNASLQETVDIIKRDTRRYAKRQLTWFRRFENIQWYNLSEYPSKEKLINNIQEYIEGHFNVL